MKNGRVLLIPASDQTAGHGTTGQAKFWKNELAELLRTAESGAVAPPRSLRHLPAKQ